MALCIQSMLRNVAARSIYNTSKASLGSLQLVVNRNFGSAGSADSASASFKHGIVLLSVPLPSRNELCEFTLKPITHSVKDLVQFIKDEDGGVERAAVYNNEGIRISNSTPIEFLMQNDFKILVNEKEYDVVPPKEGSYIEHREEQIQRMLEHLNSELEPLEDSKALLDQKAARRTNILVWGGLAYMAAQFGFLARLTWWEYSWDIMEPVTYFVTYGSSIAMYAYFVLTREEYTYNYARDRAHLIRFHKEAEGNKFDLLKYNNIRESIAKLKAELSLLKSQPAKLPAASEAVE
eukprot:gene12896-3647_t